MKEFNKEQINNLILIETICYNLGIKNNKKTMVLLLILKIHLIMI